MIIPLDGCRMIPVLPECALSFLPFIIPALSDRQPTVSTGVLHLCLRHHIQASEYDWRSRCSSVSTIRIVSSPQEATEAIGIGPLRISARSPSYDTYLSGRSQRRSLMGYVPDMSGYIVSIRSCHGLFSIGLFSVPKRSLFEHYGPCLSHHIL